MTNMRSYQEVAYDIQEQYSESYRQIEERDERDQFLFLAQVRDEECPKEILVMLRKITKILRQAGVNPRTLCPKIEPKQWWYDSKKRILMYQWNVGEPNINLLLKWVREDWEK